MRELILEAATTFTYISPFIVAVLAFIAWRHSKDIDKANKKRNSR